MGSLKAAEDQTSPSADHATWPSQTPTEEQTVKLSRKSTKSHTRKHRDVDGLVGKQSESNKCKKPSKKRRSSSEFLDAAESMHATAPAAPKYDAAAAPRSTPLGPADTGGDSAREERRPKKKRKPSRDVPQVPHGEADADSHFPEAKARSANEGEEPRDLPLRARKRKSDSKKQKRVREKSHSDTVHQPKEQASPNRTNSPAVTAADKHTPASVAEKVHHGADETAEKKKKNEKKRFAEPRHSGNSASTEQAVPITGDKPSDATNGAEQKPESRPATEDDRELLNEERLKRTLFVGNIATTAKRKALHKLFSRFGRVESVRIRNVIAANPKIPKKTALLTKRLATFADSFSAYVVFEPSDDIEAILHKACESTNMTLFMDKHIRVMEANQSRGGPRRQSIFVGNLPFDCSEEELVEAFMPIAKENDISLVNIRVNKDKDTGVGRGVGFVSFSDILGVQASLNRAGEIKIRDRVVRVERAIKTKNMKSKAYKSRRRQHFGNNKPTAQR